MLEWRSAHNGQNESKISEGLRMHATSVPAAEAQLLLKNHPKSQSLALGVLVTATSKTLRSARRSLNGSVLLTIEQSG